MGTMTESAKALLPELIKIRRDFHEYPELSGKEEETAKKEECSWEYLWRQRRTASWATVSRNG